MYLDKKGMRGTVYTPTSKPIWKKEDSVEQNVLQIAEHVSWLYRHTMGLGHLKDQAQVLEAYVLIPWWKIRAKAKIRKAILSRKYTSSYILDLIKKV